MDTISHESYDQALAILGMGYQSHWLNLSTVEQGHKFILVATDYFTKQDEVIPLKR